MGGAHEQNSTSLFSGNTWTAPANGWIDGTVTLNVINQSTQADDSMTWGLYKNGSVIQQVVDNWRWISAGSGIEVITTQTFGFHVNSGDTVIVYYDGIQNAMNIYGGGTDERGSRWTGTFTPDAV